MEQLCFTFEEPQPIVVFVPRQADTPIPEASPPALETAVATTLSAEDPAPVPVLVAAPRPVYTEGVELFKHGNSIGFRAHDIRSALALDEFLRRQSAPAMRTLAYYDPDTQDPQDQWTSQDMRIDQIVRRGGLNHDPRLKALQLYGVALHVEPGLKGYLDKELRRYRIESTPYKRDEQVVDISLFDRCVRGMILTCTKDFYTQHRKKLFLQGQRYVVTEVAEDGQASISIAKNPVRNSSVVLDHATDVYTWSEFDPSLEEHFDDAEVYQDAPDLTIQYPDRVKAMEEKLRKLGLSVYKHVAQDAAQAALKRTVLNAYPMRLGKTSSAIAVAMLAGSQKVGVSCPNNARHYWVKEFKRMGFTEGQDFVQVKKWADLARPTRFHVMTLSWLRHRVDPAEEARREKTTILSPVSMKVKIQDPNTTERKLIQVTEPRTNRCPHCQQPLHRWAKLIDADRMDPETGTPILTGLQNQWGWTTNNGYRCRNPQCSWVDIHPRPRRGSKVAPTPWHTGATHQTRGGYVDWEIARHANCQDQAIKGRQCPQCKTVDATWKPGNYKRLTRRFTHWIFDEIHDIKDNTRQSYQALSSLRARRKQGLSGMPISKTPTDIYWLLHTLYKGPSALFPYVRTAGHTEFDQRFCDSVILERPAGSFTDEDGKLVQITKTVRKPIPFLKNPPEFWQFTSPLMLRRTYQDKLFLESLEATGRKMAEADPSLFKVTMNRQQALLMLKSIEDFKHAFETLEKQAVSSHQQLNLAKVQNMTQMVTLRILATCPEYLNEKLGRQVYTGPPGGAKIQVIEQLVEDRVRSRGSKVVVLTDFHAMQKAVADRLAPYGVIRFLNRWDEETRAEAFEQFERDPSKTVFVAGTRTIRQSVDLSAADVCICADLLWSPLMQAQAWSRILTPTERQRTCEIILLASEGTIDEQIFQALYASLKGSQQALDRKTLDRRVRTADVYWFRDRILETEKFLRQFYFEDEAVILPDLSGSQRHLMEES